MRPLVALLLLGLLSAELCSARLFSANTKHLKRPVGRRQAGRDGKLHYKEVAAEDFGRAAFDPQYAADDELHAEDLGMAEQDVHEATPSVIENRLKELFPVIDSNHNGVISTEELSRHLYANGMDISRRRAEAEFADTDANKDGRVTAQEYLAQLVDANDAKAKAALESGAFPSPLDYASFVDVTRAAIFLADVDHNGGLNQAEFYDFLNPEEGSNVPLKLHRLRQDIHDHMHAHDGAHGEGGHDAAHIHGVEELEVTFDQFYDFFWGQFTVWDNHNDGSEYSEEREREAAMRKFVLLDTNSDHKLTAEELLPAFADIHPTENRYARMQAEHMMDMADCKDDRLSLDKMLAVPHAFYGVVHDHDEL